MTLPAHISSLGSEIQKRNMPRFRRRYPLLIYRRMLNRWWPATLIISLALLVAWWQAAQNMPWELDLWRLDIWLLFSACLALLWTLALFTMSRMAYVQVLPDRLRLVTPFLRMNISYKRIRRTSTAAMYALFPPERLTDSKREILEPLAGKTAIVIELNSLPIPRSTLNLFLSPFFFKDQTPHIVILVNDWLKFSTELESQRSAQGAPQPKARPLSSILAHLPDKDK
jgi:hypothetical protein